MERCCGNDQSQLLGAHSRAPRILFHPHGGYLGAAAILTMERLPTLPCRSQPPYRRAHYPSVRRHELFTQMLLLGGRGGGRWDLHGEGLRVRLGQGA